MGEVGKGAVSGCLPMMRLSNATANDVISTDEDPRLTVILILKVMGSSWQVSGSRAVTMMGV